jgi:hypothetical protein
MIIWVAIFASLFIYLIIVIAAGKGIRKGSSGLLPIPIFRNILICVAVVEVFIIQIFRRLLISTSAVHRLDESNIPSSQIPVVIQYSNFIIISCALAESIGIYGLILYFLGANITTLYLFLGASALVMVYHHPKKDELVNLATEYEMGLAQKSSVH